MINCLGKSVRDTLVTVIRKSKFISVMVDEFVGCIDDRVIGGLHTVLDLGS